MGQSWSEVGSVVMVNWSFTLSSGGLMEHVNRDDIVINRIVPHTNKQPDQNLIMVPDNTPIHKPRIVMNAITQRGVQYME